MIWDYIIVGAGSAGCVLANRLSERRGINVLLIEAGPPDRHPYLRIPKGFAKTLANPELTWFHKVETGEVWPRGKTLGGSSSINGMMYVRGHPEDYDAWERAGIRGWGWNRIGAAFRAMERHSLGASESRGGSGPLHVLARPPETIPVCEALVAAGREMGLPLRQDLNEDAEEGIGYLPATIHKGMRWSAATAFLAPARSRPNLRVETGMAVNQVLFDGKKAVGVEAEGADGSVARFRGAEIILCAGAIQSPQLLQLSGIGPANLLSNLGIPLIQDSPGVGGNMLEHRLLSFQFRIRRGGYNRRLRGVGLLASVLQYALQRRGPLSTGAYQVGGFVKLHPEEARPDAELLMGPYSVDLAGKGMTMEADPGLRIISFPLRPRSQGSVRIRSADPRDAPSIQPNYLADPYDRDISVRSAHFIRKLASQPALADIMVGEQWPGARMADDDAIVAAYRERGVAGMHASSTCRMGLDRLAVVDPRLRVHGVQGIRVMDCSVLPSMVSGNTNGPVMAMAWNAADIILEDARAGRGG